MKKNTFKAMVTGIIIGAMTTGGVSVLANNGTINIPATFKNIRIFVDGAELTPRDSYGNVLEPFIYNGSTYLPVRAVAEAVGKDVSYDANTNSVYLGQSKSSFSQNGINMEPYQMICLTTRDVSMGGVNYHDAIVSDYSTNGGTAYYNLSGRYTSVSGVYGTEDGSCTEEAEFTLRFYGDNILLKEYSFRGGELPKNFSVNISGVAQLKIEADKADDDWGSKIGLGEISFK